MSLRELKKRRAELQLTLDRMDEARDETARLIERLTDKIRDEEQRRLPPFRPIRMTLEETADA